MAAELDPKMLDRVVEGLALTHQRLLQVADEMTPDQFAEPSFLPGWSRNTLLGHLTMNARSFVHLMSCAARGEVGEQYPGAPSTRQDGIDEASAWEPSKTVSELRKSIYTLEGAWAGATSVVWQGTGNMAGGSIAPMHELPFRRWRESVIHLTDLNMGISYNEWPDYYVRLELERQKMAWAASHPMGLTQLPQAAMKLPEKQRLAWLLQREDVEGLPKGPGL
jgi:maleylpyruvate isomerase